MRLWVYRSVLIKKEPSGNHTAESSKSSTLKAMIEVWNTNNKTDLTHQQISAVYSGEERFHGKNICVIGSTTPIRHCSSSPTTYILT